MRFEAPFSISVYIISGHCYFDSRNQNEPLGRKPLTLTTTRTLPLPGPSSRYRSGTVGIDTDGSGLCDGRDGDGPRLPSRDLKEALEAAVALIFRWGSWRC